MNLIHSGEAPWVDTDRMDAIMQDVWDKNPPVMNPSSLSVSSRSDGGGGAEAGRLLLGAGRERVAGIFVSRARMRWVHPYTKSWH